MRNVYENPNTGEHIEADVDYDVNTGKDRNVEERKYRKVKGLIDVVNPKTNQSYRIDDSQLKTELSKGYILKEQHEANDSKPDTAQVAKYGSVGKAEAAVRGFSQIVPVTDELAGMVANPIGALKSAAEYFTPYKPDKNDKDVKEYNAPRDLARARNEQGSENHPLGYYSTQLTGGIALPGATGKATSLLGKIGIGAAEGGAYAIGGSNNENIKDDVGTIGVGSVLGGGIQAGLGIAGKVWDGIRGTLAKKGDGLGEEYLSDPSKIVDDLGAEERATKIATDMRRSKLDTESTLFGLDETIENETSALAAGQNKLQKNVDTLSTNMKTRNLDADSNKQYLDSQIANEADRAKSIEADRLSQANKVKVDIESSKEATRLYKEAAEDTLEEFKVTNSDEARKRISELMGKYKSELNVLGEQREKRFELLEGEPASEITLNAYNELKKKLTINIGELSKKQAVDALTQLEEYLPESGVDGITQGQLLKRIKMVNDGLWDKVKDGPGFGTKNFNQRQIAKLVHNAFIDSGDEVISSLTREMSGPLNKNQFLQKAAAKRVPEYTESNRNTTTFSPDPMKAERSSPETFNSFKRVGYEPEINNAVQAKSKEMQVGLNEINDQIQKLEIEQQRIGSLPNNAQTALESLKVQRRVLEESTGISNNKDGRQLLKNKASLGTFVDNGKGRIEKLTKERTTVQGDAARLANLDKRELLSANMQTQRINKLERSKGSTGAVDFAADLATGPLGRVTRHGLGAIASPTRQIQAYNTVKEFFQKPALTAMVKVLTLGGRTLSRAAIVNMAAQHNVDPVELERVIREGGN